MAKMDAVYARQSVEKKNSLSISGQIALCCKAAGGSDLKVYQDRGYSGKNTERPDFQRLLKDIKADQIDTLYVYRLDRFSRSVADFGQLWEIMQAHQVEFVSINESFDTKTPMGRAMLHIIMVFAQLERETTAERVRDNYYRRTALGAWPGGPAPYGFSIGRAHTSDGRQIPTLTPNDKAEVVLRLFQEYAEEEVSLSKLAQKLSREGIPGPSRATWDNVTLSRILHNPTYVMADEQVRLHYMSYGVHIAVDESAFDGVHGAMLVGKRDRGQKKHTNLKDHTLTVLNSLGIVPSDLWLKCQAKLSRNQQIGNSGKGTHTWLSGLLKCAKCGYSLKVLTEKSYRWLVCSGRYNMSRCDATIRVKLDELEQAAAQEIQSMIDQSPAEAPSMTEKDVYAEQLEEIDRRADRLVDAFAESNDMDRSYLQRALRRLEQERQSILDARKRETSRPSLPDKLEFDSLSFEEKKLVASQYIERIEVNEQDAEIIWKV